MSGQKGSKGFTLLEVLVAVLVIALVVTAVFELYWRGFRGIDRAESTLQAVVLSESALEEVLAQAVADSVEEALPEGFSLSVHTERTEDSPLVTVRIILRQKGRQKMTLSSGGLVYEQQ